MTQNQQRDKNRADPQPAADTSEPKKRSIISRIKTFITGRDDADEREDPVEIPDPMMTTHGRVDRQAFRGDEGRSNRGDHGSGAEDQQPTSHESKLGTGGGSNRGHGRGDFRGAGGRGERGGRGRPERRGKPGVEGARGKKTHVAQVNVEEGKLREFVETARFLPHARRSVMKFAIARIIFESQVPTAPRKQAPQEGAPADSAVTQGGAQSPAEPLRPRYPIGDIYERAGSIRSFMRDLRDEDVPGLDDRHDGLAALQRMVMCLESCENDPMRQKWLEDHRVRYVQKACKIWVGQVQRYLENHPEARKSPEEYIAEASASRRRWEAVQDARLFGPIASSKRAPRGALAPQQGPVESVEAVAGA